MTGASYKLTAAQKSYVLRAMVLRARLSNKALSRRLGISETTLGRMTRKPEFAQALCRAIGRYNAALKPTAPLKKGRPRALSADQEMRVFEEITSAPVAHSGRIYKRLSKELGAARPTLSAIVTEHRKRRLTQIIDRFQQTGSTV